MTTSTTTAAPFVVVTVVIVVALRAISSWPSKEEVNFVSRSSTLPGRLTVSTLFSTRGPPRVGWRLTASIALRPMTQCRQ